MIIKTHKIRIYPNKQMQQILDRGFDYSRYCYNQGLEIWNTCYDSFKLTNDKAHRPNERKVRDILVNEKPEWAYTMSARILQQAIHRLGQAWANFFNPKMRNAKQPKFKSKRSARQSFTTDRARVNGRYLTLDQPFGQRYMQIKMAEILRFTSDIKTVTITKRALRYFASINVAVAEAKPQFLNSYDVDAVDMNIKHLDSRSIRLNTLPQRLVDKYKRVKHYQRQLARKRLAKPDHYLSRNYKRAKAKLNQCHLDIKNIQQDMIQKFSTQVLANCDTVAIEDLNVDGMKMNKRLAKSIHRALFRRSRDMFVYKTAWQGKNLVIVDRWFPSTQKCSRCGYIKTVETAGGKHKLSGDDVHHDHQHYYCYNCGAILDRDKNAVQNLMDYAVGLTAAAN